MTGDNPAATAPDGFQVSIHARRVTGDSLILVVLLIEIVSIHARRVTGDLLTEVSQLWPVVSIHARRVTGDTRAAFYRSSKPFQFTPVV